MLNCVTMRITIIDIHSAGGEVRAFFRVLTIRFSMCSLAMLNGSVTSDKILLDSKAKPLKRLSIRLSTEYSYTTQILDLTGIGPHIQNNVSEL
jgi:hypothetical protein